MNKRAFFVYGTLLHGLGNHRVIEPFVETIQPATLSNAEMYAIPRAFPYIMHKEGSSVVGEVITVSDEQYEEALQHCDWLEGYNSELDAEAAQKRCLYVREAATVTTASGETMDVWVYFAGRVHSGFDRVEHVEDGDYKNYLNNALATR